ncbi:TetR/AcrR family transcriptional regulator [Methylosinus sp. LW4]|uniref:TetR/AcrR family transcriptional regulator n=1 Tax=Methylosinus sp. LW4 TaxID=136993 RepID=UPI0004779126|nr:TetR/AcrR family transcriptional regulator [Methylosinus sp. LW4]
MRPSPLAPAEALESSAGRKETQIVSAARNEFLKRGFGETSMESIARAAGVSKTTLYAYFQSKEALFSHLIESECDEKRMFKPAPMIGSCIDSALRGLGKEFILHFLSQDETKFFQTVSSERLRFPGLCQLYFRTGQNKANEFVAAFLEDAKAQGWLTFGDAHLAANQFLNLILSDLPMRVALGLDLPNEAEAERVMEAGVFVFLSAYRAAPTKGA